MEKCIGWKSVSVHRFDILRLGLITDSLDIRIDMKLHASHITFLYYFYRIFKY